MDCALRTQVCRGKVSGNLGNTTELKFLPSIVKVSSMQHINRDKVHDFIIAILPECCDVLGTIIYTKCLPSCSQHTSMS